MRGDWSDERLMLAYRAGDADAFDALYRRYRGSLYRYLAQQCGNPALADELYQDIWIKVVKARADYEPLARFSTWIYRIFDLDLPYCPPSADRPLPQARAADRRALRRQRSR